MESGSERRRRKTSLVDGGDVDLVAESASVAVSEISARSVDDDAAQAKTGDVGRRRNSRVHRPTRPALP